jgi:hypothetical protein
MKFDWRNNKDFLGGLLLIGLGAIGFYMALDYPFGSAMRMGPGYFPRALAGILIAFGVYVMIRGIRSGEKVSGIWGWKPLAFITASLLRVQCRAVAAKSALLLHRRVRRHCDRRAARHRARNLGVLQLHGGEAP